MVLLVVDTQELITNEALYQFGIFKENVKRLINTARRSQIEVIYVCHDDGPGGDLVRDMAGFNVYHEFAPHEGEKTFTKTVNSPFKESGLLDYLKQKNEGDIMVTGLQTDFCIDATIKCGFEHGFHMIVPADANSTRSNSFMTAEESYKYYNEYIWPVRYAECIPMAEAELRLINK